MKEKRRIGRRMLVRECIARERSHGACVQRAMCSNETFVAEELLRYRSAKRFTVEVRALYKYSFRGNNVFPAGRKCILRRRQETWHSTFAQRQIGDGEHSRPSARARCAFAETVRRCVENHSSCDKINFLQSLITTRRQRSSNTNAWTCGGSTTRT